MGFDFIVCGSGPAVVQCFLHLRAEPGVICGRVGSEGERQRTFVGNARQEDTHGIRDSQSHIFEHRSRALFQRGVERVCTNAVATMQLLLRISLDFLL